MSQEAAAAAIGVSSKAWRDWEHSKGIKWPNVLAVSELLEVDPESIVQREGRDEAMELVESQPSALEPIEERLAALETKLLVELAEVRSDLAEMQRYQERWRHREEDTGS